MRSAPKQIKYHGQVYKLAAPEVVHVSTIDKWVKSNGQLLARSMAKTLQQLLEQAYHFKFSSQDAQGLARYLQWVLFTPFKGPAPAGLPPVVQDPRARQDIQGYLAALIDDIYTAALGEEAEQNPEYRKEMGLPPL